MVDTKNRQVVVVGGGPAGLTAAYELTKYGIKPVVYEQSENVGGIARTEHYRGFYFDMGGHRFYTKSQPVKKMWDEVLGEHFLLRPRLSRIFYKNKFFNYPLKPLNAFLGLGPWQSFLAVLSYLRWQLFPYKKVENFEEWVTNRFGKRLFLTFFKIYTEKVWGISCKVLKAEWAAQRIKELSLKSAILSMFINSNNKITSLIEQFHYPSRGPGMLWWEVTKQVENRGGSVCLNSEVTKIHLEDHHVTSIVVRNGDHEELVEGTDFIFSMPVSELVKRMDRAPDYVVDAARQLRYRDFLTVCLIVNQPELFPDNWIYIHSPEVKVGRIQNYKNWSPEMAPDPNKTSLGLEYFCTVGDEIWNMPDSELIALGKMEIDRIGLARAEDVIDGVVFRVPKAYPIYDAEYRDALDTIRQFIASLENCQTIGRNGLHRYNNQDHSMLTGMLAVRNIVFHEKNDLWKVNTDMEYHETVKTDQDIVRAVRRRIEPATARVDPVAFGTAFGLTAGLALLFATLFLVIKGGPIVGPNLALLENFFPGFSVTWAGSFLGFVYMAIIGFYVGWGGAYLRNLIVFLSAIAIYRDIEWRTMKHFLDFI